MECYTDLEVNGNGQERMEITKKKGMKKVKESNDNAVDMKMTICARTYTEIPMKKKPEKV